MRVDPLIQFAAVGLVALVFARALLEKMSDYPAYAAALRDYRLIPDALAPAAAATLATLEAATMAMLVAPFTRMYGAALAIALLSLYAGAMSLALAAGRREIECGCGGEGQTVSWLLVLRNCALIAITALALAPTTPRTMNWGDVAGGACAILIGLLILGGAEKLIENAAAVRRLRSDSYL